jgi:predicted RNA methylase
MGLDLAGFQAGASILDIGCGDGRILIRGIQRGARSATGYELDSNVYKLACAHVSAALGKHDQSRVQIIEGDARNAELSSVDLITMYLIPKGLRLMEEHLDEQIQLNQMSQQTKVLTFGWRMPNWIPEAERSTVGGCKMYLYSVPSLAS